MLVSIAHHDALILHLDFHLIDLVKWHLSQQPKCDVCSAGSISEVLIVKDTKHGHTVSNIPDKNSEKKKDGIEMEFKCVDKIKKALELDPAATQVMVPRSALDTATTRYDLEVQYTISGNRKGAITANTD